MANIEKKTGRRYRVQFTVTQTLHLTYQNCLRQADNLGLSIDFTKDFQRWFSGQVEQVAKDLDKLATTNDTTRVADKSVGIR